MEQASAVTLFWCIKIYTYYNGNLGIFGLLFLSVHTGKLLSSLSTSDCVRHLNTHWYITSFKLKRHTIFNSFKLPFSLFSRSSISLQREITPLLVVSFFFFSSSPLQYIYNVSNISIDLKISNRQQVSCWVGGSHQTFKCSRVSCVTLLFQRSFSYVSTLLRLNGASIQEGQIGILLYTSIVYLSFFFFLSFGAKEFFFFYSLCAIFLKERILFFFFSTCRCFSSFFFVVFSVNRTPAADAAAPGRKKKEMKIKQEEGGIHYNLMLPSFSMDFGRVYTYVCMRVQR